MVKVQYLAQKLNTMSPVRARIRTARSGVELINQEATVRFFHSEVHYEKPFFYVSIYWSPFLSDLEVL